MARGEGPDVEVGRSGVRALCATTMIGDRVRVGAEEDIGLLHDLLIEEETGAVLCGVVSRGGILEAGDTLFLAAWAAFRIDTEANGFILSVPAEQLANAVTFNDAAWPDLSSPGALDEAFAMGSLPMHIPSNRRVLRLRSLVGEKVRGLDGAELGKLYEVIVEMPGGRATYALVAFGGVLGLGERLLPVPFRILGFHTDGKDHLLDLTPERLEDAPAFEKEAWPNLADPAWGRRVHEFWTKPLLDLDIR